MRHPPPYLIEKIDEKIDEKELMWIRKCPTCNKDIIHHNFQSAKNCHKQKRLCGSCGCWNKGLTKKTNQSISRMSKKVSESMKKLRKTLPPWNMGLSKENNPIIATMAENHRGFVHTEKTKKTIRECSKRCWKNKTYREKIIQKLREIIGDTSHINEWRLKMESGGYFTPLELKTDFEKYQRKVWAYTRKNNLSILENHKKRGRADYHLDHKYSISRGFLDEIPPEIIGSIHNLEMLPHKKNIQKNSKCSISKEKLLQLYYVGENQI